MPEANPETHSVPPLTYRGVVLVDLNKDLPPKHPDRTYGLPDRSVVFTLAEIIEARCRQLVFTMHAMGQDTEITTDIETLLLPVNELARLETDDPKRLGFKFTP